MKKPAAKTQLIRYWHPRKGGWYYGALIRRGYKWAIIRNHRGNSQRIALSNIREVA